VIGRLGAARRRPHDDCWSEPLEVRCADRLGRSRLAR